MNHVKLAWQGRWRVALGVIGLCALGLQAPRLFAAAIVVPASALLNTNLITNGDAEAGLASGDGSVVAVPGWTVQGYLTVVYYGAETFFTSYPTPTEPGPDNRGSNFFAGGLDNATSSASQLLDVSAGATLLDTGEVRYQLGGHLGGWYIQNDHALATVTFLSQAAAVLGQTNIGPVLATDRGLTTGLWPRTATGRVPVGTRRIEIVLRMNRSNEFFNYDNDGYADNLSLVLSYGLMICVDAQAGLRPISPGIYGLSHATPGELSALNAPLNRYGGNHTTRHNWTINAVNKGADWYFESLRLQDKPGERHWEHFIQDTKGAGAEPLMTIPILGWVAKLGANGEALWSYSIATYGAQTRHDTNNTNHIDAGNGVNLAGVAITWNDPTDANVPSRAARAIDGALAPPETVFQEDWVRTIASRGWPSPWRDVRYYILDNEYFLWHKTHRDVHPQAASMDEMWEKMRNCALMVKTIDPGAWVVGPDEYGWDGYRYSARDFLYAQAHGWDYDNAPDFSTHGRMLFLPWLLQQFRAYEQAHGRRLLDVLSVHHYPQGPQGNEFDTDEVNGDANELREEIKLRRNQSTRTLWDPNYQTYIGPGHTPTVRLVPLLREWVQAHYPNTKIAITEYNWGAEGHMNGATAQADILGIFGREGLDIATRWPKHWPRPEAGDLNLPVYGAFKMYRNYDGARSTFGEVSVSAKVGDPASPPVDISDQVSTFAALRADGALTVMVVHKNLTGLRPVSLQLESFCPSGTVEMWQLAATNPEGTAGAITNPLRTNYAGGVFSTPPQLPLPPQSVTLFVIKGDVPVLVFNTHSAVDLVVRDSSGRVTSKASQGIPHSRYLSYGSDASSEPGATVIVYQPTAGDYQVQAVPQAGAPPTETCSVYASTADGRVALVKGQSLGSLPSEGFGLHYESGQMQTTNSASAVVLEAPSRVADGVFGFRIKAEDSRFVVIQASTNLIDWTSVATNCPGGGAIEFVEQLVAEAGRFYRVLAR